MISFGTIYKAQLPFNILKKFKILYVLYIEMNKCGSRKKNLFN